MKSSNPLCTIMNPKSIAVVGASNNPLKMGTIQYLSILRSQYPGKIFILHPRDKVVLGKQAYKQVDELPEVPELAFFVTPSSTTVSLLESFGKLGTKHAVIITAGFREIGNKGQELEKQVIEVADKYGIRFVGPNCMGILNPHLPLNLTVLPYLEKPGTLGIASQSGTYITQSLVYLYKRGIRISRAISLGNETNIDLVDALEYFGEDEETKAIALYIEGVKRGDKLLEVAQRISRKKPIVAQYVGGTASGARSGASHTGAMAGPDHLYNGLFKQAGIIKADTVEELYDFGWTLACQPPMKGKRVAILSNSGGPATAMANTLDQFEMEIPIFSENLQNKIKSIIPPHGSAKNPIDLTFHMDTSAIAAKIPEMLFHSDEIDGILTHGIMDTGFMKVMYPHFKDFLPLPKEQFITSNLTDMSTITKLPFEKQIPLAASAFFDREDHCVEQFMENTIPTFTSPEKAARALTILYEYHCIQENMKHSFFNQNKSVSDSEYIIENKTTIQSIIDKALQNNQNALDEYDSKMVLELIGIPVGKQKLIKNFEEALEAAKPIGFPLVLKGCSYEYMHKSEKNLVHLNIMTEMELKEKINQIQNEIPNIPILIQKQIQSTREFVVGMTRYPGMPPFLMFGLGGIFTEVLKDTTFRCAPLSHQEALNMVQDIRSKKLLEKVRNLPPVDKKILADIILGIAKLSLSFPQIKEIDINPLMIDGSTPVAVDALMILKDS